MTDMTINEEKSSRKKILVPLVVLLLCGVALTGAAYAYTATLAVNSNNADAGYLSIDLDGGSVTDSVTFADSNVVVFTDNFAYTKTTTGNTTTWGKTDWVQYNLAAGNIVTYALEISRDNATVVDVDVSIASLAAITIPVDGTDTALSDLFNITVKLDNNDAVVATVGNDGTATASFDDVTIGDHTVVIGLTLKTQTTTGYVTAEAIASTSTNPAYKVASEYQSAFVGNNFAVTFTVDSATA